MAVFRRTKRVTDPLDDKVKACICGRDHRRASDFSSGSEHEAEDSPCLSNLVQSFLESNADESAGDEAKSPGNASDSDRDISINDTTEQIKDLLNPTPNSGKSLDSDRLLLLSHVSKAVETFSCLRSNKPVFRRKIMIYLRDQYGQNAGICKTKWERTGGLTAGSYEFIDVVRSGSSGDVRYFIDVDFAGEFEIARPTLQYERILNVLPRIFIGRSDELKQIVRLMSEAMKRSLRTQGLHLPPWRKNRCMQMKWLGPYLRTVNQTPASTSSSLPQGVAVKCTSVGFNAVCNVNGRSVFPAATRTR